MGRYVFFFSFISLFAFSLDLNEIEKNLTKDGQKGGIHGVNPQTRAIVFTVRDPKDFFSFEDFPLIPTTPEIKTQLESLNRHDQVIVKGSFKKEGVPLYHIKVTSIEVTKKFEKFYPKVGDYEYQAKLPDDLKEKTEIVVRVHAVVNEGKVLVVEYKDGVLPVIVSKPELVKKLFRNDKVKLAIVVKEIPPKPTHIEINTKVEKPVEILESVVGMHGKEVTLEGELVFFPKSPQVNRNIFALQNIDKEGLAREHTLVNFEDPKVFDAILAKLQKIWDGAVDTMKPARNKYINPKIQIKVKGRYNVVDANQANPQILLTGPDAIEVL